MSQPEAAVAPHRATILVGFGSFGLDVLRRLLASAAPRGVLTWEEPRGGAAPSDRHLRDLALLWVPDRKDAEDVESVREGNALEMMRDLYRQIETVEVSDRLDERFAKRLCDAAEMLLSASARAGRSDALPLGLDVIVLARPTGREVIGTLDRVLVRGMDTLANNANLLRAVQGAQTLNFIAIYDFDNYWDLSESGRTVRRALHGSIEEWQRRRVSSKPAFGRFYVVDGRTRDAVREAFVRVDEISLFLEFLLFEGQRGGELQRLFQPLGPFEGAVSTFGIRLMERSAGLLGRLAAARFSIGWLEYLVGASPFVDTEPSHLRQRLDAYEPEALDRLLEADSLRRGIEEDVGALERELTALAVELPDWPAQVRQEYEDAARRMEEKVAQAAQSQMAKVSSTALVTLPDDFRSGVDADLHDARRPRTMGSVIAEIEASLARLDRAPEAVLPSSEASGQALRRMTDLHGAYGAFHRGTLRVEGLRRFWPLFAIALAAGFTPIVHELLGDIPKPSSLRFLADRAYALLQWIDNPAVLGLLLFALVLAIGAAGFHPRIAARIERARRWYLDPARGRFIDRVRSGLRPGGTLRQDIDGRVDRVLLEMTLSVRGVVSRELGRVLERLGDRKREILWLREQLRGFLRMHGITGEDLRADDGRLRRDETGVRHAVERGEDLEAVLRSNHGPERFRDVQTSQMPFAGWHERYSRAFLAPLEFLERLSALYHDPFQQELSRPGIGPEQQRLTAEIQEFLKGQPLELGFNFVAQEGLPPDRRYALLPPLWRGLRGVMPALADRGIGEASVFSGAETGRAYLLRLRTGVETKCLVEPE
ncbi:MAG: hypothetical protein ACJ74H_02065 [Thermoanaerobaculia bacterium]